MNAPALAALALLTGAPADTAYRPPEWPAALIAPAIEVQDLPVPAAPVAPVLVPQATPAVPPDPLAPTPAPQAEGNNGDIVVTARARVPGDPLARVNEVSFATTQAMDKAIIGPVSLGFAKIVPAPAREGLGNFLYNLQEIDVCLNFLLQHKFGKAVETAGRFLINSTLGVFGLFDIAKRRPFRLPRRSNGFADTFGFYGVKPGPYLFLPVVGPTTPRDLIGRILDKLVVPTSLGTPFNTSRYTIPTTVGSVLDTRADFDDQLQKFRASGNPYAARRDYYLGRRQAEIDHLRGRDGGKFADPAKAPVSPDISAPKMPAPKRESPTSASGDPQTPWE